MSLNDLGSVPASTTIYLFWTSHDGATGANEAASNLAVGDILIYKNGSTTQRASTSGFTLLDTDGIDFDGLTGVNGVSIDLSDNTDAGFYAVGSWYTVILGPITIDTQTVYLNLASFRIVAAEAITGKPKVDVDGWLGTAAATPTVAGVPEVDITHIGGTAVTAAAGIPEVKVASIAANAITAAATAADFSTEVNTAVLAVLGALNDAAADGDPTTTDTIVAYLKQIINTLEGTAGLPAFPASAAPGNAVSLAEAIRQIYDEVAGLDGAAMITQANIRTAVGLASANLDTQIDALPTAAENADAVWDEDATAHQTGGTFGQAIGDPGADTNTIFKAVVTDASGATVGADTTAILADTDEIQQELADGGRLDLLIDAILADTNELQGDWANGGRLDLLIDAIKAKTELYNTTLADSVPADGTRPTDREALYMICQFLFERVVTGTAISVKKVDGTTELFTLALNDATSPTSITRDG